MNAAQTAAAETALFALRTYYTVLFHRVILAMDGTTIVWAIVDAGAGKGRLVCWDGGETGDSVDAETIVELTRYPLPLADLRAKRIHRDAVLLRDWT